MRTIVIGDVHGCAGTLLALLDRVAPNMDDMVVMLGDLFDRGPDSYGVFKLVESLALSLGDRFVLLRGNHEDYLLSESLTLRQRWVWNQVGRGDTVKSFKANGARMEDAVPFLRENCRLYWQGSRFQCVHAGLRKMPIEENDINTLIHDHTVAEENQYAGPLTIVGHVALFAPTHFPGDQQEPEMLPPGEKLPLPQTGIICIDTGCGKGGILTALVAEGDQYTLECVRQKG